MVLGWSAPADNGGADIRGYFVDYRTVKGGVVGQWHEMNHEAVTTNSYKVNYLISVTMPSVIIDCNLLSWQAVCADCHVK